MTKKITKREKFTKIAKILTEGGYTDLVETIEHEIELLDKKAATAKAKAVEKKTEGDDLSAAVEAVLTDEYESIADIASKVEFDGATVAKVQYRLRMLAENGKAEKGEVKVDGGEGAKARKLVAYRIPQTPSED